MRDIYPSYYIKVTFRLGEPNEHDYYIDFQNGDQIFLEDNRIKIRNVYNSLCEAQKDLKVILPFIEDLCSTNCTNILYIEKIIFSVEKLLKTIIYNGTIT